MITKTAMDAWDEYAKDQAVDELTEAPITRKKGIGYGTALGAAAGAGAALLRGRRSIGRALIGGGLGMGLGGAVGEVAHRSDAESRENAKQYLQYYNLRKMRELFRRPQQNMQSY
jgi:hypothetical protein